MKSSTINYIYRLADEYGLYGELPLGTTCNIDIICACFTDQDGGEAPDVFASHLLDILIECGEDKWLDM